eukprot:366520-Chlamydomonas_euryale.AAC.8
MLDPQLSLTQLPRGSPPAVRLDLPHVRLQHTLGHRRPLVCLVRALHLCQLARLLERRVVDGLKDVAIQLLGLSAVERQAQQEESIRKALHTEPDWAMAHVGAACCLDRVEVHVNDLV